MPTVRSKNQQLHACGHISCCVLAVLLTLECGGWHESEALLGQVDQLQSLSADDVSVRHHALSGGARRLLARGVLVLVGLVRSAALTATS